MSNRSYSQGEKDNPNRPAPGSGLELLKLLAHEAPEVRGLTAMLVGKLADKLPISAQVDAAVRELAATDTDKRVRQAAHQGIAGIERGDAKRPAAHALITPHGGYEDLESYKMAEIAFDGTVFFCNRYISLRSRTHDQMWQAARSGKQNIAEGSQVSGTSKKTEIKLVSVARGSLEELKKDYQDYLRTHELPIWDKNDPRARSVRNLAYAKDRSYKTYRPYFENGKPETCANALLCVIHQACYLLDKQLKALETEFVEQGGFTERLYRVRSEKRRKKQN